MRLLKLLPFRSAVLSLLLAMLAMTATAATAGVYTVNSTGDTWINEASTAQNNRTTTTLRATASSTGTSRTRALLAFTLPTIPANETITSAVLRLRVTTTSTRLVTVHRATLAWTESTATWANMNAFFDASSEASFTPSTAATISIDISALVQNWRAGTHANNGVMLLGANSSTVQFASEENGTVANRPQLVITTAVVAPSLTVVKSHSLISDPANGAVNPKFIPGATVRYTVTASNSAAGAADSNSTVFTDTVPPGMQMFVGDVGPTGSGPISFANGATSSGLTYSFVSLGSTTDSLSFSNNGGASFTYTPVADALGYDGNVTHVRITLTGAFAGKTGAADPSLSMQMLMKVR
jgi:trimeric autotransporter adhesin